MFALAACDASDPADAPPSYTRVFVESVTLHDAPFANEDNNAWDTIAGGPDFLVSIFDGNGDSIAESATVQDAAPSSLPLTFNTEIELDFARTYGVAVYDEDVSGYELVAYTDGFSPGALAAEQDYPATYELTRPGVRVALALRWVE